MAIKPNGQGVGTNWRLCHTQIYRGEKMLSTDEGPHAGSDFCHPCHSSPSISVCTSSKRNYEQARRHVAAEMDVYLFVYSLSQQITDSVEV